MNMNKTITERPILFSGQMIKAILAGHKTETRRIVKPQPGEEWDGIKIKCRNYYPVAVDKNGEQYPGEVVFGFADEDSRWKCFYGAPGDRLWVREKFQFIKGFGNFDFGVHYMATNDITGWIDKEGKVPQPVNEEIRPSIFMPRWASRITLEIVEIGIERLQEISVDSISKEGYRDDNGNPRDWYHNLWELINGIGSWNKNPWIWVIQFKQIK
jgi:hypothetical protein